MNGAESLITTLVNCGVEVCFTNPGTSEMHFVAALDEVEGMRAVLGLFEGVVTGAADGYARMAGKPAATLLHLGPGLGNSLANIHNAQKGHVPMVNIVGDHATYHLQYDAPLTSDIEGIAATVSDWVYTSESSENIANDAARAYSEAGKHRIATLVLPADVSWSDNPNGVAAPLPAVPLNRVSADALSRAVAMLQSGKRTMLMVGGSIDEELGHLLSRVAQHTGARLCVETFPTRLSRGAGRAKMEKLPYLAEMATDFIKDVENLILIGAKSPVSFFAYPELPSELQPKDCTVLPLALPEDDIKDGVQRLLAELGAEALTPSCYERQKSEAPQGALNAMSVAQAIAHYLPENAIVVDEGATTGLPVFPMTEQSASHDWLTLTGGSIGFGLPAAVGAAIACPDRKVVCLEGDGSAMYTIQSLWTMAREELDVTVILYNNAKYNILELEFARTGARGGIPGPKASQTLDIGNPNMDFVAIAQGMGVAAARAETAEEFNALLEKSLNTPGPFLIDAIVPPMKF